MAFLIWEVYGLLLDKLIHFGVILCTSVEGRESHNHLVCQDTQGPPIYRERVTLLGQDFWCQIVRSSTERCCFGISFENFSESEISETNVSILVHEDILRFQISVDDFL